MQTRYDNKLMGFFNTFLNPGALTRIQTSDIADKLEELGDKSLYPEYLAPKSFQVNGETVMVSGKDMTETYQKTYGENISGMYGGLMDNEDFNKLPEEAQIAALKQANTYAKQLAKASVSDFDDVPEGTTEEILQGILQKQAGKLLADPMEDATDAWKDGKDAAEAAESLEEAYQVYKGLSEPMRETVLEGLSERVRGYIEARNAGQTPESYLGSAKAVTITEQHMDQLRDAWKEGEDGSAAFEGLDQAYQYYSNLDSSQKEQVLENVTAKTRYFLEARAAGMKTETFTGLYQKYLDIEQREDMTATRRANAWAAELREAMEERRISKTQHDLLRESMVFRSSQEAEATRFDSFVEQGIDTDDAAKLAEMMYSIKGTGSYDPETGKNTVRDIDRMQAVAGAVYLTTDERFDAMRAFMTEGQIEKMETLRDEFDLSAPQYAALYRAYLPQDKKAEEIDAYVKLGYSKQDAERIYRIYHPK